MKLLKNKAVAIIIMVAAIVLSSFYGLWKKPAVLVPEGGKALDTALSTVAYEPFIVDEANVLSGQTEQRLCIYNANWDRMTGSIMAVVTVEEAGGDVDAAAWDWADRLQLGENDAILLMDTGAEDYRVVARGGFYDRLAAQSGSFVDSCMAEYIQRGDYSSGALNLFGQLHVIFSASSSNSGAGGILAAVIPVLILLVVLVVLFSVIDGIRYSSWYGRYGTMGVPPVVYRPILWWHRPGTAASRRRQFPSSRRWKPQTAEKRRHNAQIESAPLDPAPQRQFRRRFPWGKFWQQPWRQLRRRLARRQLWRRSWRQLRRRFPWGRLWRTAVVFAL